MKVQAPFEVWQQAVPIESGQAQGYQILVVPVRFCKQKFSGEKFSRVGNFYKPENGQLIGWCSYFKGTYFWRML